MSTAAHIWHNGMLIWNGTSGTEVEQVMAAWRKLTQPLQLGQGQGRGREQRRQQRREEAGQYWYSFSYAMSGTGLRAAMRCPRY
eukprot:2452682-Rhodomonas_salina.1